jgi:hypothetical protein
MSANQQLGSVVSDGVLGGPRDVAKTGLFEAQSPEDASSHPPEMTAETGAALCTGFDRAPVHLRGAERCPARAFKEMSGTPNSR